jgi:hypothetical protein
VNFYRWAMRNGAPILFVVAPIVFVVSFIGQFLMGMTSVNHIDFPSEPGHASMRLIFLVSAAASALSNCATIFAAACIVDILGRRYSTKKGEDR